MSSIDQTIQTEIKALKEAGLYKKERIITTPQSAAITTTAGEEVLNFCANNYLGLSSHPAVLVCRRSGLSVAHRTSIKN